MATSRAQFLSTGLVPVPTTSEPCAICTGDLTAPVQLPCKHIYCTACVSTWLGQPGRNTCPTCRSKLFTLPQTEDLLPSTSRWAQVSRAVALTAIASEADLVHSIPTTQPRLDRAHAAARAYLSFDQTLVPTGPVTLDLAFLQAYVVAMGNLLPALAAVQDRSYTRVQMTEWHQILGRLWTVLLEISPRRTFDAVGFPEIMTDRLRTHMDLRGYYPGRMAALDVRLSADDSPRGDLVTLLRFLAHVSRDRQEEMEGRARTAERMAAGRERVRREESRCAVM